MSFNKEEYWDRRKKGVRGQTVPQVEPTKESNLESRPAIRRSKKVVDKWQKSHDSVV